MKGKKVLMVASCHLFAVLTFFFFAPMEVILLNRDEFHYTFESIWWFQLLLVVFAAALMTSITMLFPNKARTKIASLSLGAGTAAWIQMMFMNGRMVQLTGTQMQVSNAEMIVNLVIWVVIIAAILILALLLERRGYKVMTWMSVMAGLLTVVQATAFMSLLITTDFSESKDGHILTKSGEFELSNDTNVVVFLMDAADGNVVHRMLETYPEVSEQLSGWVYFPNTVSEYSRTYPALTYLLTGEKTHMDRPREEYVEEAFEKSDYMRNMNNVGTDIRIFTMDTSYVGMNADEIIRNAQKNDYRFSDLNVPGLEKGLVRISLFKCLPYLCKQLVAYQVPVLNITAFKAQRYSYYDPYVYGDFAGRNVFKTTDRYKKAFRFYHLWSAHRGMNWNDKLVFTEKHETQHDRLRGSFRLLEEYCNEMKKAGVYDKALIIVIADHGESNGDYKNLTQDKAACPLLMIKYPGSEETGKLEISKAPVCQEDLFATITDAIGADRTHEGSGRTIQEIAETEERDRIYNYIALDENLEEILLREYVIQGDAENYNNWKETGNVWYP